MLVLLLLRLFAEASGREVACRIKLVPTRKNIATNSTGAGILKFQIEHNAQTDAITIRGRQNSYAQTAKNVIDGISFYLDDSIKSRQHPMLSIRIKNSRKISNQWKELPTIIVIWTKDEKTGEYRQTKETFPDVPYSNSTDVIFQILPDTNGLTLFINGHKIQIAVPIMKYFGSVQQRDELTWFKEISICHRQKLFLKMFRYDESDPEHCMEKKCDSVKDASNIPNIHMGKKVILICSVNGIPPMSVKWYRNQKLLNNNDVYSISERKFTSKTKRLYKLSFTMSTDTDGMYTCYIENQYRPEVNVSGYYEAVGYQPRYVKIIPKPYVVIPEGSSALFTCNVYQYPLNKYSLITWQAVPEIGKSLKISLDGTRHRKDLQSSSVLEFTNATVADTGIFLCGDSIATLYVERKATSIAARTLNNRGTFELACSAVGSPPPKLSVTMYSVYKGVRTLIPVKLTQTNETKTSIEMSWRIDTDNKVYKVEYTCYGTQLMSKGRVFETKLNGKSDILHPMVMALQAMVNRTQQPGLPGYRIEEGSAELLTSETLQVGKDLMLVCTVHSNPPPPYIVLMRGGELVKTTGVSGDEDYMPRLSYTIHNASDVHNGTYHCTVPAPCVRQQCPEPVPLCHRTCEETSDEIQARTESNDTTNPCPITCTAIAPAREPCSTDCVPTNQAQQSMDILLYSQIRVSLESPDFTGSNSNIRLGSHPLIICKVHSIPPPLDVKINLGNLTKVYSGNVKNSNDLVLQRYIPISEEVQITCLSSHSFRRHKYDQIATVKLIPLEEAASTSFVYTWSGPLIILVFGGGVFLSLMVIVIIILACVNERKCRVQHRGLVVYEGDEDRANKRLTSESIERASHINMLLTQLIEQPFTDGVAGKTPRNLSELESHSSYTSSGNMTEDISDESSTNMAETDDIFSGDVDGTEEEGTLPRTTREEGTLPRNTRNTDYINVDIHNRKGSLHYEI